MDESGETLVQRQRFYPLKCETVRAAGAVRRLEMDKVRRSTASDAAADMRPGHDGEEYARLENLMPAETAFHMVNS